MQHLKAGVATNGKKKMFLGKPEKSCFCRAEVGNLKSLRGKQRPGKKSQEKDRKRKRMKNAMHENLTTKGGICDFKIGGLRGALCLLSQSAIGLAISLGAARIKDF